MNSIYASMLALTSFSLAAACTSPPPPTWEPLDIQQRIDLDYAAQLGPQGFENLDRAVGPTTVRSGGVQDATTRGEHIAGPTLVTSVKVMQMTLPKGRRLLGQDRKKVDQHTGVLSDTLFLRDAGLLDSASALPRIRALLRSGDATLIDEGKLVSTPGQRVCYSHIDQTAYVKAFRFETQKEAYIADPVVDVALSGIRRFLTIDKDGSGGHRIQLQIREVQLQRPFPLFVSQTHPLERVTIQTPVYRSMQMDADVGIAQGQLLYIATPFHRQGSDDEQTLLLTLIGCQTQE